MTRKDVIQYKEFVDSTENEIVDKEITTTTTVITKTIFNGQTTTKTTKTTSILYTHEEIPHYLRKHNIHKSYRHNLTYKDCTHSLFYLHNETLNIWTHLFAFLLFLYLTVRVLFIESDPIYITPNQKIHQTDFIIFLLFSISAMICFLFSGVYHTYFCSSEEAFCKFSQLDYIGISTFISGCLISSIYFGYYCNEYLQKIYVGGCALFCLCTSILLNLTKYHKDEYQHFRIFAFLFQVSFCLVPLIHWVYLTGPFSEEVTTTLPKILFMFFLFGVAFVFYSTKFPERFFPGRFDIYLASHQIWHVVVVLAALWQFFTLQDHYRMKHGHCGL